MPRNTSPSKPGPSPQPRTMPPDRVETHEELTRRAPAGDVGALIAWLSRYGGLGWAVPPILCRH
jgi:hypothetical protein